MITVYVAKQPVEIDHEQSIHDFLQTHGYMHEYIAVALNQQFIPRCEHNQTFVRHNDHIDIITPMQGG